MAIHKNLTGDEAIHQAAYIQSSDPGAVGADKLWIDTTTDPPQLKRRNSSDDGWVTVINQSNSSLVAIPAVIGNGSDEIATGVAGYLEVPFAGTIIAVRLLSTVSGSIVVDIWKDSYANYPPTDADSITSATPPMLSAETKSQDTTLSGWTTSVAAGDILGFNVDSVTDCTQVLLSITIRKS